MQLRRMNYLITFILVSILFFNLYSIPLQKTPSSIFPVKELVSCDICDLDKDGYFDLIAVKISEFAVYSGKKGWDSAPVYRNAEDAGGMWVTALDLDKDGFPEVAVNRPLYLEIYKNESGQLKSEPVWKRSQIGKPCQHFCFSDINRDGLPDLVVRALARIEIFLNRDGIVSENPEIIIKLPANLSGGRAMICCDVNLDGWVDILLASSHPEVTEGALAIYLNKNGKFSSEPQWVSKSLYGINSFVCSDFNNDKFPDVAVATNFGAKIYLNNQKGGFSEKVWWQEKEPTQSTYSLLVADVNQDGWNDLIVGGSTSKEQVTKNTRIYLNTQRSLTAQPSWEAECKGSDGNLFWLDLDRDGHRELVVTQLFERVLIYKQILK